MFSLIRQCSRLVPDPLVMADQPGLAWNERPLVPSQLTLQQPAHILSGGIDSLRVALSLTNMFFVQGQKRCPVPVEVHPAHKVSGSKRLPPVILHMGVNRPLQKCS